MNIGKKKVILIGKTGSGKTTLIQALNRLPKSYKKTQTIEYYNNLVDTPGEYIENRRFYNALIVSSYDCDLIALIQDCTSEIPVFPPNFASLFNKPVIGVITKIDSKEKNIKMASDCLYQTGIQRIFKVSSLFGTGIAKLRDFLLDFEI